MYSYKEKIKHYRDLSAPDHVLIDLEHLRKVDPRNEHLPSFENAPARNADKILYALLDLVTAEEIRNYRRQVILDRSAAEEEAARLEEEKNAREEAERLAKVEAERLAAEQAEAERIAAEKAAQEETERLAKEKEEAEKAAREEAERVEKEKADAEKAAQEEAERLAAEKAQLEEQLEETEFERDNAIEEKEDLEEKLADTETELEEVKAELEEEKKSEVKPVVKAPAKPESSKKKTNTQTSGGKTSKTRTSK